ncbi:TolC family protein [Tenacibaculum larymnensis]|uniref:TolC family protein n=1 Tax=Tenacibaculum larymnensis TaxID=2878201 RepID=A0A9X4EWE3_9FLAO|nr:TolC family protein [Tenacibaculum larymnensis]MDE1207646.1 TolC family protein [Tenacibaculum larymnensis]
MNKRIAFTLCGCLFYMFMTAQETHFSSLFKQIEQNNKELKAFKSFTESEKLKTKSTNNLSDPEVIGYYLPFASQSNASDYTEFEISQSFEFPTVYAARKKWSNLKAEELNYKYNELKQSILLKANKLLVKVISLNKLKKIRENRHQKSKKVYEQVLALYQKEQVGILELNKAKITWIQVRFQVEKTELEQASLLKELANLNGGKSIEFNQNDYLEKSAIETFETLWNNKLTKDPLLNYYNVQENVSLQQIKVAQQKILPNLTFGYNNQGISGNRISGIMGGISIPLWSTKNKVKAAKYKHQFQVDNKRSKVSNIEAKYFQLYNSYVLLHKKYTDYKNTMASLNSDELIYKAYEFGEFSFMEYHLELDFYHKAIDEMLNMELELQLLKTELYKHTL